MTDNAMLHLYQVSHRGWVRRWRSRQPAWTRWYGILALLYFAAVGLYTLSLAARYGGFQAALGLFLLEVAGFAAVVLPSSAGTGAYMGLRALRQGRCLEEMLNSRLTPTQIADGLTLAALRSVGRELLGVWLVLLGGTALLLESLGPLPLLGALLWLPLVGGLGWLAAVHWARCSVLRPRDYLVDGLLALGLLSLLGAVSLLPTWASVPGVAILVLGAPLGFTWWARRQTIERMGQGEVQGTPRAPRAAVEVDAHLNPLLARERMRQGSWSWWSRHWDAVVTLGVGCAYALQASAASTSVHHDPALPFYLVLLIAGLVAPARAAFRSLEVFQADRQAGSLDSLLISRLTLREAVEGAARLGWERPLRELALGVLTLVPMGLALHWLERSPGGLDGLAYLFTAALVGGVAAYFGLISLAIGSYLGTAAGMRSATRQEAWARLVGWFLLIYVMSVMASLAVVGVGLWTQSFPWTVTLALLMISLGPLGAALWARRLAYRSLAHSEAQPGFR